MKWIIVLALAALLPLPGCQNDLQLDVLPTPAAEKDGPNSTAPPKIEPITVVEDGSSIVETETPAPVATAEIAHDNRVTISGVANANVLFVKAQLAGDDSWTFKVTVEHPDTGWEDYADGWDVVLPDGMVVKPDPESPFTRLLLHPHETEQPFTRSQSGVKIPPAIKRVTVRAHDLVDGFGGKEVVVDLSVAGGPDFEVVR